MNRAFFFVSILACTAAAAAQGPPMPAPGPELKKLDYFVGTWKSDAEMKQMGSNAPSVKMSGEDRIEWMSGHFFLAIHSTETIPGMHVLASGFMGYDPESKSYTMDIFNSVGDAEHSK